MLYLSLINVDTIIVNVGKLRTQNYSSLSIYPFNIKPSLSSLHNAIKKVNVFHSLIAVGAGGVRVPLYLGHS